MKIKVYLLILIAVIAAMLAAYTLLTVNAKNESWTSVIIGFFVGAAVVFLMRYLKSRNQPRNS